MESLQSKSTYASQSDQQQESDESNFILRFFLLALLLLKSLFAWALQPVAQHDGFTKLTKEGKRKSRKLSRAWRRFWRKKGDKNKYKESANFITDRMLSSEDEGSTSSDGTQP